MANHYDEIEEVKASITGFVGALGRLKTVLGKEIDAYSEANSITPVAKAFHKVQICADQSISALMELDMVLSDLLSE